MDGWNPFTPFGWLLVIGLFAFYTWACTRTDTPAPQPEATPTPIVIVEPTPSENGLVYFKATDKMYWDSLEAFYKKNPDLHCDYQGATEELIEEGYAQTRTRYARITGHILHCHDTSVYAPSETIQ
jgi:hypothetical protein